MNSKVCTGCKENKSLDSYHKAPKEKDGLVDRCKDCKKEYYTKNRERILNSYHQTKDARKPVGEKWREANKEHLSNYSKEYRKAIKDKVAFWNGTRRALKIKATPPWLSQDQLDQIAYYYTLSKDAYILTGEDHHVYHIIPLKGRNICGLHVPWNLQVLSKSENLRKGNKF